MPEKIRVMHLITKLELGGAQQNTLYCTANHDRGKFEVLLAAGQGGMLDQEAQAIPDASILFLPWLKHAIHPFYDVLAIFKLIALLRKERVGILHTHSSKAGILGRFAAHFAKTPVVIHTIHGWSFNDWQFFPVRWLYILLERRAAKWSYALIAVSSENVSKGLRRKIGRKEQYCVIHSGIELDPFLTAHKGKLRKELGIPADTPLIGMVSNFKAQKAPLDFVRAAQIVHQAMPEVKFIMAGDGELKDETQRLITELKLQDSVLLLGWRRDIPELMADIDILALSSLWEGLPRVFPQAMAAGKPIVATSVDGAREAIQDGREGFLTPPRHFSSMALRLIQVLKDPALRERMGRAGREKALKEFDIKNMVRDIDELYLKKWNSRVRGN